MSRPEGRLLVDARPIEHPTARNRGIGRYTTGLINGLQEIGAAPLALAANAAEAELICLQLPGVEVVIHSAQVAASAGWYIATGLFLHPLSNDPIPSYVTQARLPVASIMYDVIPYRFPELYQVAEPARRQAALRAPLARTVDVHLAISQFSADTAIAELDLDPTSMHVVGTGVDPRFHRDPTVARRADGPVVAITGRDTHKNNERLIAAWGLVERELRSRHGLVIVGNLGGELTSRLQDVARVAGCGDEVRFSGGIDDAELIALLRSARLSVMASLEEGFGLPVAEAAACGCPTITSGVSSLPEVLDEPHACFDPLSIEDIARALASGLTDPDLRARLLAAADRSEPRWRWPAVAERVIAALSA
jgi:O-antigen biosynthesis alpha-1,2-mannosyltransferase